MWWISVLLDRVSVFSIIIFLRCVFLTIFFRREMLRIEKTVALCRNCSLLFLNVLIFLIFPDYLFFFFSMLRLVMMQSKCSSIAQILLDILKRILHESVQQIPVGWFVLKRLVTKVLDIAVLL